MVTITEKPTTIKNVTPESVEAMKKDTEDLRNKLDTLTMLPKKKYTYSMTSAQEYGWDMDTDMGTYKPQYEFNKKMCNETKYASDYVTMTKRSPYAARRPEGQQPAK